MECISPFSCVSDMCDCKEMEYYDSLKSKCLLQKDQDDDCRKDIQCKSPFSCVSGKCNCEEMEYFDSHKSNCLPQKDQDSPCRKDIECKAPFSCVSRKCNCKAMEYFDSHKSKCLPQKDQDSPCRKDIECKAPLSCVSRKCNCKAMEYFDSHKSKCLPQKDQGSNCGKDIQCKAPFKCISDKCNCKREEYFDSGSAKCLTIIPCHDGWEHYKGQCYYVSSEKKSWYDARDACIYQYGGHLTKILDAETNEFMQDLAREYDGDCWIGLNDLKHENDFHWADDNKRPKFTSWGKNPQEPNNYHNEDCTHLRKIVGYNWNDLSCSKSLRFSCQRNPGPVVIPCKDNWELYNGQCYQMFSNKISWYEARDTCIYKHGGHLTKILDAGTNKFITGLARKNYDSYWLGFNDIKHEGSFFWTDDNSKVEFAAWADRQPDNWRNEEDCGHLWDEKNLAWNDRICSYKYKYSCQRNPGLVTTVLPCHDGWEHFKGQCYYVSSEKKSWYDARDTCIYQYGGHLTKILDAGTNKFMQGLARENDGDCWIGLNDLKHENDFHWTDDNKRPKFTSWGKNPQEPNNYHNEDCTHLRKVVDYEWNDLTCSDHLKFSCQRNPGPVVIPCHGGWEPYKGQCYQMFPDKKTWQEARDSCIYKHGGHLTKILDAGTNEFIKGLAKKDYDSYWIGLNDIKLEGSFYWADDNSKASFAAWSHGQPDNWGNKEDCVHLWHERDLAWNDNVCSYKTKYSCQRNPGPIKKDQHGNCENDKNCKSPFSCVSGECDCKAMEYFDSSKCLPKKDQGGDCKKDIECKGPLKCVSSNCNCKAMEYFDSSKCLPKKDQGSNCGKDIQCKAPFKCISGKCNCKREEYFDSGSAKCLPLILCPDGWKHYKGQCYYVSSEKKSWSDARDTCIYQYGGHLTKILDAETNEFMQGLARKNDGDCWIGLNDLNNENDFRWADDNKQPKFTSWAKNPQEPNNYLNEDCTHLRKVKNYNWNDLRCSSLLKFSCQRNPGPIKLIANCKKGWQSYNGRCYRMFLEEKQWSDARDYCNNVGGHLATILDDGTNKFLQAMAKKNNRHCWVGLNDRQKEGSFFWEAPRIAPSFKSWAKSPQEPNDQVNEDCVHLDQRRKFDWNDKECDAKLCFACERPPGPFVLSCPNGWESYGGYCYKMFSDTKTWQEARDSCKNEHGGHLTAIRNAETSDFIKGLARKHPESYWIGLSDIKHEGSYRWEDDNSQVSFTSWAKNQPDNYHNKEDCIHLVEDQDYNWNDLSCYKKLRYSCQRKPIHHVKPACPDGWHFNEKEKTCYHLAKGIANWYDSRKTCQKYGGDLIQIRNKEINDYILDLVTKQPGQYWIALNDLKHEGKFKWLDEHEETKFTYWQSHEPNNDHGKEDCAYITPDSCKWNDINCEHSSVISYSCQCLIWDCINYKH